jgi:hypothetical protein
VRTTIPHLPAVGYDDEPEVTRKRGGIERIVSLRRVVAQCSDCGTSFHSTGPAASHARTQRHEVAVQYFAEFDYLPVERER